jgi:protein subunit release factor A
MNQFENTTPQVIYDELVRIEREIYEVSKELAEALRTAAKSKIAAEIARAKALSDINASVSPEMKITESIRNALALLQSAKEAEFAAITDADAAALSKQLSALLAIHSSCQTRAKLLLNELKLASNSPVI